MKKTEQTPTIDVIEIIDDCVAPSVEHKHCASGQFFSVALAEISVNDAKALLTLGRAVPSDVNTRNASEGKTTATQKKDTQ